MKIIFATGCLGFMASDFVRAALNKNWKVYGVDKLTYAANVELLREFNSYPNFKFIQKDINDLKYFEDCDYIINYAASSHVENRITDSKEFIKTNILGVKNILELIKNKHDNCNDKPTLIQISTDEVYGDITTGEHFETDILNPSNPYSASKAAGDLLILAWARTHNLKYIILRPTNNYGRFQYPEKLIPLSVKNLLRGKKIRLHNKGEPIRNWLNVSDTTSAVFTVIESGITNEIYNIAGGFEQSNKETVKKIIKYFHGTEENWEQYVDLNHVRKGQDVRYALNDDKIRKLGWKPVKNFDKEIEDLVEFYKRNTRW